MKIDFSKPELICWMLVPIVILFGIFSENHTIDIQAHDTYFLIANTQLAIIVSGMFFIHGLIYWEVLRNNFIQKTTLTLIHVALSTLGLFILVNFRSFREPLVYIFIPISILLLSSVLLGLIIILTNFIIVLTKK